MVLQVFLIGFFFSFIGSIPPGTLNLLVLQLGLENRIKAAIHFSLAVAIVEYPYAWIAVAFEDVIMSTPVILENFKLLAAVTMSLMGILSIWSVRNPSITNAKLEGNGFIRGIILSILNPQAIPFWIATTAYLKAEGWIVIDSTLTIHSYLLGTAVGVLALLLLLIYGSGKLSYQITSNKFIRMAPGIMLVLLGLYAWLKYFQVIA